MRFLFKSIFWLLFLSFIGLGVATWFALSDQAWVAPGKPLSHLDIARAKAIIKANDPREYPAGTEKTLRIQESDIRLALNYLLSRLPDAASKVAIDSRSMQVIASARVPKLPLKNTLNVRFNLPATSGIPQIRNLQIGQIPVPDALANWVLQKGLSQMMLDGEYRLAEEVVQGVKMAPGVAAITYVWQPELIEKARQEYFSSSDKAALQAYHAKLYDLAQKGLSGSLTHALQPLFAFAAERSEQNDPIEETRALLLVLGAWANGRGMNALIGTQATEKKLGDFPLTLEGRNDFGQHFLTSAALVAGGDQRLSDAIGLFKEIDDSDGGSGFSFTDLAADRAGTRFAELALKAESNADFIQHRIAKGVPETDFMPKARDLPEGMPEADFQRRFGGVDDPRYQKIAQEIERRIDAAPLFRDIH